MLRQEGAALLGLPLLKLAPDARDGAITARCPACDDHLALGKEAHGIAALWVQRAEERAFRAAEREVGHRRRDANIDADVAGFRTIAEFACRIAALGKDGGSIAIIMRVNQLDGFVQAIKRRHSDHRAKDLLLVNVHLGLDGIQDRRSDKVASRIFGHDLLATIQHRIRALLHALRDRGYDALARRRRDNRSHVHSWLETIAKPDRKSTR